MYLFVIHLTILSISTLPISFLGTLIIFRLNITPCCQTFFCLAKKKTTHIFFVFYSFNFHMFLFLAMSNIFTTCTNHCSTEYSRHSLNISEILSLCSSLFYSAQKTLTTLICPNFQLCLQNSGRPPGSDRVPFSILQPGNFL